MSKVLGLDRLLIMVKDIDKALDFFSGTLGMNFKELEEGISKRDGIRSYICHEAHLHLISPILPLSDKLPPPMKKNMELLDKSEAVLLAITFKVDNVDEIEDKLSKSGVRFPHGYSESSDYKSEGLDKFREIVTAAEDTFGITFGFTSYCGNSSEEKNNSAIKVTDMDRIVIMVKDMDKALEFFSGKLGMKFLELDEEVQKRDGNRGMVCHETHLHLVSPILPLPETAPLPLRQGAEMLRNRDAVILVTLFKVDNPMKAKEELQNKGFNILRVWEETQDYASVGMTNLEEFLINPEDTFGIPICLSNYQLK